MNQHWLPYVVVTLAGSNVLNVYGPLPTQDAAVEFADGLRPAIKAGPIADKAIVRQMGYPHPDAEGFYR